MGKINSEDWKNLLLAQQQLGKHFTDVLWNEFSQPQREELDAEHPEIFKE